MSDINYGDGNDFIDLSLLPPDQRQSNVLAGGGNDTIVGAASFTGIVIPGSGNDVISNTSVAYFYDPAGVTVNLRGGTATDGYGGHDSLSGVLSLHGSGWNDTLIGSDSSEWFAGNGGSDTIDGGGGDDAAYFSGTQGDYTFSFSTDRQTLFVNDGRGALDTLTNIENLQFDGTSTSVSSLRYALIGTPYFRQNDWTLDSSLVSTINGLNVPYTWSQASAIGDFTGDGNLDVVITASEFVFPTGQPRNGPTPGRLYLLEGRGDGSFVNGSWRLPDNGLYDAFVRKFRVGDFNSDGTLDFVPASNYEDGRAAANSLSIAAPQYVFLSHAGKIDKVALDFPTWGHGVAVGDYNSDGKTDFYLEPVMDLYFEL